MTTPSFVRIPDDSSNTGKKVRTVQRVVGSDTVQEHVVQIVYGQDISGLYYVDSGLVTILQTAQASDEGFNYLINPVGSTKVVSIRRIKFFSTPTSTSTRSNVPVMRIERFTFTGTASASTVTPAKRITSEPDSTATFRIASTGLTITPGNVVRSYVVPLVPSGGNVSAPLDTVWEPVDNEGELILLAGEGIMFRQHTDGSSGDDRATTINYTWVEY